MKTRKEIKNEAKQYLRDCYFKSFIVGLIILFSGGFTLFSLNAVFNYETLDVQLTLMKFYAKIKDPIEALILIASFFVAFVIFLFLFRLFVGYVLSVGAAAYFLNIKKGENQSLLSLGKGFFEGYRKIVFTMFMRDLKIFLWSLLFGIPGIMKTYSYRFVPYILARNPNMRMREVHKLSREMTKGHKANLFIMDLSFILWVIMGSLTFIGGIFVIPYEQSVRARVFEMHEKMEDMKKEALNYKEPLDNTSAAKEDTDIFSQFDNLDNFYNK